MNLVDVPATRRPAMGGLRLPSGWIVYALLGAFPVWWALGLGALIWPVMAFPMLLWLLRREDIKAPRGFGLWVVFLAWMLASATQIDSADRMTAFLYRGSQYLSVTLLFLYVYNTPRESLPARRVVVALSILWIAVVAGGFLGVLWPGGEFGTVAEKVLPDRLANDASLKYVVRPRFAQESRILGYTIGRPAAPFPYTNAWGSNFALLTPFVIMSWAHIKSKLWTRLTRLTLMASVVPVIFSLDRGLWLSLGLGLIYAAFRFALQGRVRPFIGVMAIITVAAGLVALPPIRQVAIDRINTPHSDEGRKALYGEATERALDSPIVGYGAPVRSVVDPSKPSVGTHGQFWLVLVSHGIPGTIFFFAWFLLLLWRTRGGSVSLGQWCHVVLVISLIQMAFYEQLPAQLHIVVVAAALALREMRSAQDSPALQAADADRDRRLVRLA